MRHFFLFVVAFVVTFSSSNLRAAEPKEAAVDDPDFLVQGEYLGEVSKPDGKKRFGVQVIALGKGKFRAMSRSGGLPGDGWDKNDSTGVECETVDGATSFQATEYTAKIKDGSMTLTSDGKAIGELKRIVRKSPTLGAKPPKGVVVLFDGTNADQFENGRVTKDGQ